MLNKTLLLERLTHYQGPIELHITTTLKNTPTEKTRFKKACAALNAKSIFIELAKGQTTNQPMLGLRIDQSPQEQKNKIEQIANALSKAFSVVRIKVEAGPQNKNIPQTKEAAANEPSDCYIEHHIALNIKPETNMQELRASAADFHGYLSRNAFKKKGEFETRFITQRFHKLGQKEADAKLAELIKHLKSENIDVQDIEREYNIFDTRLSLDEGWMP